MGAHTLRSSAEFKRVMRTGRRARRNGLMVYARPAAGAVPSRIGVAVRCDRAVDRNLLKRRLRSAWRAAAVPPGFEIVVRGDRDALSVGYQDLETHLIEGLRAAGVGV